jgi:plastocyanin
MAALLLVAAGCGDDDDSGDDDAAPESSVPTPDGIVVGAGINDPEDATIAVLEFLPEKITIEAGTDVTWEWNGGEPHSVTFVPPGQEVPDIEADPTAAQGVPPTGPIDGSTYVSSPLQPLGPPGAPDFEASFATEGTYPYICIIHPNMTGEVEVVAAGGDADTPADVAQRRADETSQWLEEGRQAKADLDDAEVVKTAKDDGTTEWTVQMGTTTEHVDILAFAPTPADVKAGDTVTFVNESFAPHTASFNAPEGITPFDDATTNPAPGPSPQPLSSSAYVNTGVLPPNVGPPPEARTFSFTVPDPGTYAYVCIFHAPSNMVGEITAT